MSNASLVFNEFPGSYASNPSTYRASENRAGDGQNSQRYYQSSSSLAAALTPVVSNMEGGKPHLDLWPQIRSDNLKTDMQAQLSESCVNNKGWYTEHRIHGQTIPRSASVMPGRQMNAWNSVNNFQGSYEGNHSPLDNDTGSRRAFTPAPQDMHQRQVPFNKFRDPLYTRPGIPFHTFPSSSVSPTKHQAPFSYYLEPSSERLYSGGATSDSVLPSTAPADLVSSGYSTAEQLTPVGEQLSFSPEFLYVNMDKAEDELTIHCPYKWCKSTFTRTNDLARHLATASMHRESVPVDSSKRCRLCGEEFSRSDARNRHEIKRSCGKKRTRRAAAV